MPVVSSSRHLFATPLLYTTLGVVSHFLSIAWENRSTSGFFHRRLVHWHSFGRKARRSDGQQIT